MANLFDQANERKKWDATIAQVGQMGYPQNPAQPPAFTSPQPRRPASFGDAAAATSNPGVTQLPPSATLASAVPGAPPQAAPTAPNPTDQRLSMGTPPAQPASTSGGLNAPWWSGEYATAARLSDKSGLELEQQRAAAATPSQAPANDPVKRIINTGTLAMPQAVTKPADVAPAAPAAPNPTDQRLAAGTQQAPTPAQQPSGNSPVGMSVADAQKQGLVGERVGYDPAYDQRLTGAPGQNGAVTRNGNSYSGSNIAGDVTFRNPDGSVRRSGGSVSALPAGASPMGPAAGFVPGGISTQNMGAADALASREYAASMGRLMASGQIQAPGAGPSFIMQSNTGFRRDPRLVAPEDAARRTLRYAQGDDPASRERKAKFQTAQLEQQGLAQRNQATNDIAQKELALKTEAQGFTTRAAQRMEDLSGVLLDPNATPEQRSVAQRNLAALSGNTEDARKNVVTLGGGQEWDAQAGAMRNVPQRAIDLRTGQEIGVRAGGQAQAMPPGMTRQVGTAGGKPVYEDANGKRFVGG